LNLVFFLVGERRKKKSVGPEAGSKRPCFPLEAPSVPLRLTGILAGPLCERDSLRVA